MIYIADEKLETLIEATKRKIFTIGIRNILTHRSYNKTLISIVSKNKKGVGLSRNFSLL
jgi:hypothetical protein